MTFYSHAVDLATARPNLILYLTRLVKSRNFCWSFPSNHELLIMGIFLVSSRRLGAFFAEILKISKRRCVRRASLSATTHPENVHTYPTPNGIFRSQLNKTLRGHIWAWQHCLKESFLNLNIKKGIKRPGRIILSTVFNQDSRCEPEKTFESWVSFKNHEVKKSKARGCRKNSEF